MPENDQEIRRMVDELGQPVEDQATRIDRTIEKLRGEGVTAEADYLSGAEQVPDDADVHIVGEWPNGEPMVVRTFWR